MELFDFSYDVPTTYSINPYTGENITHLGYHVENKSRGMKIKNQPFEPYFDESRNHVVYFYYHIRYKGSFTENWTELYYPDEYPKQDSGEYTVLIFLSESGRGIKTASKMISFPDGGQVDFQVEALIGAVHRDASTYWAPYVFSGEKSGWSETLSITVPLSTSSPAISPSPTQTPTPYQEPQQVDFNI